MTRGPRFAVMLSLVVVVVQRLLLLIAVFISQTNQAPTLYTLLVRNFTRWDSGWYVQIAEHGYVNLKQTAFFPLYPMLMRVVHSLSGLDYATSGIIISLISFFLALVFLHCVVEREFDRRTATAAVMLCAFFPTAYYFDAVYTESLFLALFMAAVYASRTERFWLAGLLAGLAALTRNTGLLLVVVLAMDYARARALHPRDGLRTLARRLDLESVALFIPVLTLLLYSAWLKVHTGYWLAFVEAEKYWHRTYMPPWLTFIHTMYHAARSGFMGQHQYWTFEAAAFCFGILGLVLGLSHLRRSKTQWGWWISMLAAFYLSSTEPSLNVSDYLVSLPRYALVWFPAFAYLAYALRYRVLQWSVSAAFAVVLVIKTIQFCRSLWIA